MKILIGCEFSGVIREAFSKKGHDAWSCDLIPSEIPGNHFICDVREIINLGWDMAIFHPPCTHLCVSGARWFKNKVKEQLESIEFVRYLLDLPISNLCLENPVSIISTKIRKPDQIIQPYMFGQPFVKTTCLWLKNLPKLIPTNIVEGREQKCWKESPSKERWKNRSRSYQGIAEAMASQWG